jgi:hypothetical protein
LTVEHHIRILFADPHGSSIDRIRNFGEALWQAMKRDARNLIDFEEIDLAASAISLTVRVRKRKAAMTIVEQVLDDHKMRCEARVEID